MDSKLLQCLESIACILRSNITVLFKKISTFTGLDVASMQLIKLK